MTANAAGSSSPAWYRCETPLSAPSPSRSRGERRARRRAYRGLASELLDAGADVNAEDLYGNTPLDWVEGDTGDDLLDLLVAAGGRHGVSRHLGTTLVTDGSLLVLRLPAAAPRY